MYRLLIFRKLLLFTLLSKNSNNNSTGQFVKFSDKSIKKSDFLKIIYLYIGFYDKNVFQEIL